MNPTNSQPRVATSSVLNDLLDRVPPERVTLEWLTGTLGRRSFGVVLLLLGLLGLLPGVAALAGLVLLAPAVQMTLANRGPVFTRRIASFHFPTPRVAALIRRAIPVLRYLERFIRPRWPTPFEATKRTVGLVVLLLAVCIMLIPIPFSNVPPALLVVLIAVAYLEEDGVLLCIALLASLVLLAGVGLLVWQTVNFARWLPAHV
ncbi:MAG: exopolysaccharide biosynthesis protein [Rhizomicrobium sp.]